MPKRNTWIAVADGGRAAFFTIVPPNGRLRPMPESSIEAAHLRPREIMADKPGRGFESMGHLRRALAPSSDPSDHAESDFLKSVADWLDVQARADAFDSLVIVAAPRALGMLRKHLSTAVSGRIRAEVAKNLVHATTDYIENHLRDAAVF